MKVKAKDYAKAVVAAKKVDVARVLRLLQKNGDMKKAKEVVAWVEKSLYRVVTIETARKLQKPWSAGKNDLVKEKVNPSLIAGMKIMINGEKQLDFSLSKKLNDIFK